MKFWKKGLSLLAFGLALTSFVGCTKPKEGGGENEGDGDVVSPETQDKINELRSMSYRIQIPGSGAIIEDFDLSTKYAYTDPTTFDYKEYDLSWSLPESEYAELNGNTVNVTRPAEGYPSAIITSNCRIFYPGDATIYYDFDVRFTILSVTLSAQEIVDAAIESIYIPANLECIVNDINLPKYAYFGGYEFEITWTSNVSNFSISPYDSNDAKIETLLAKVTRPEINASNVNFTLSARIGSNIAMPSENGKNENVFVSANKAFSGVIAAKTPVKTYDFIENFEYESGTYFSDIQSPYWEYIEETKRVREAEIVSEVTNSQGAVINNNVNGKNSLKILSSTVNQASYDVYVSLPETFVLETYVMVVDGGNTLNLEFRSESSRLFSMGYNQDGYPTLNGNAIVGAGKLTEGVWYKLRLELDSSNRLTLSSYNFDNNTTATVGTVNNVSVNELSKFRISVPASDSTGISYISNLAIKSSITPNAGENPNRTDGIGNAMEISNNTETIFDEYEVVNVGEEYVIKDFAIYNRFNATQKYNLTTDYTMTTTIKNKDGATVSTIDTSAVGTYTIMYEIQLTATTEKRTFTKVISIQEIGAPSIINDLVISVVRSGNITLKGTLTRENTKLYYTVLDELSTSITAEQIISNVNSGNVMSGSIDIATINLNNIISVGNNAIGKYIYITTVADNGTNGSVYKYIENSEEAPLTDVIKIRTADQFLDLITNTDTAYDLFELANNIDMTGKTWGQSPVVFYGTLDGKGYSVSNIYNKADDVAGGIFYEIRGTVQNITFENCEIIASAECGLFGKQSYGATFTNIELINLIVYGNNEINSTGYVGALVGRARGNGTTTISKVSLINDSDHYIKSSRYTGGLLGGVENATVNITDCLVRSPLIDERQCTGGLIGRAKSGGTVNISNCVINSNISSYKYAGLIIGENEISGDTIGSTVKNVVIAGIISGGETNKKNFGLISGRLQGKYVDLENIISLGARLGTNSIGESIDNSQDILVMTLDTGVYNQANPVTVSASGTYMTKYPTANMLTNEAIFKSSITFLDYTNTWVFTENGIGLRHFVN